MAENRRKDRKPLYEFDAAAVENTRTVFRFDTAKMRANHSGSLHAVVTLYEDEYTLTVATQAGVLFASFDPPIEPSIIEQIVRISKFRLS
jgi:hypothetical protein